MLTSLLLLGFAMGLRHALEADHVATVASLASRASRPRDLLAIAGAWGLGHAAVLLVLGVGVAVAGWAISQAASTLIEVGVGVVLVGLGVDVVRRARRQRIHLHAHRHRDGTYHVHAHGHTRSSPAHEHEHPARSWLRALLVGGLHGAAGSAALLLVFVQPLGVDRALAYVLVYAAGSLLGMVALSAVVTLPLRWSPPRLVRMRWALELAVGLASVAFGLGVAVRAGSGWLTP